MMAMVTSLMPVRHLVTKPPCWLHSCTIARHAHCIQEWVIDDDGNNGHGLMVRVLIMCADGDADGSVMVSVHERLIEVMER